MGGHYTVQFEVVCLRLLSGLQDLKLQRSEDVGNRDQCRSSLEGSMAISKSIMVIMVILAISMGLAVDLSMAKKVLC